MLRKVAAPVFIPPINGRPGVPARTICTPPYSPPPPSYIGGGGGSGGGGGGGETVCTSGCIVVGTEADGSPVFMCGVPVCRRT